MLYSVSRASAEHEAGVRKSEGARRSQCLWHAVGRNVALRLRTSTLSTPHSGCLPSFGPRCAWFGRIIPPTPPASLGTLKRRAQKKADAG